MQVLKLKNINSFIVFSDVHLRDPKDSLTQKFIQTLESLPQVDAIFLLGDIFDFIAVKSHYFFKLWEDVFLILKKIKAKGVKIFFLEGNHDFGFEHFKSEFLDNCFTVYGDFIVELNHQELGYVYLRHGDDVVCHSNYLKFRNFVKNKYFQKVSAMLVPAFVMQFLFTRYAKLSRKQDAYRTLPETFLKSCLFSSLSLFPKTNILILGHIHILRDEVLDNKVRFIVGPDWLSQPSYLIYSNESQFQRKLLP